MSSLPPPVAPRLQSFYAYVIVDPTTDPPKPLEVKMSRREARDALRWREDADQLRVRRIRALIYES